MSTQSSEPKCQICGSPAIIHMSSVTVVKRSPSKEMAEAIKNLERMSLDQISRICQSEATVKIFHYCEKHAPAN
jgi:hypothetical protein